MDAAALAADRARISTARRAALEPLIRARWESLAGAEGVRDWPAIAAVLDQCEAWGVWPCGGCPDRLAAWATDLLYLGRWRAEWGEQAV